MLVDDIGVCALRYGSWRSIIVRAFGTTVTKRHDPWFCQDVTITNDGATILSLLEVEHPAAKV